MENYKTSQRFFTRFIHRALGILDCISTAPICQEHHEESNLVISIHQLDEREGESLPVLMAEDRGRERCPRGPGAGGARTTAEGARSRRRGWPTAADSQEEREGRMVKVKGLTFTPSARALSYEKPHERYYRSIQR